MVQIYINYVGTFPIKGRASVPLRKGLNVIYADKVTTKEASGPRNSLGKSTFVKLIDYGLGSTSFLSKNENQAKQELLEYNLIMEVALNDKKFTLKRNLADNTGNYIYNGWVQKEFNQKEQIPIVGPKAEDYKDFLESELFQSENYLNDEKFISLRKYIPYIIRNQVGGFSDIYQPIGRSEGAAFARFRTEFFAGLNTVKKIELEQELLSIEENRKEANQDVKTISNYLKKKTEEFDKSKDAENKTEIATLSDEIDLLRKRISNRNIKESRIQKVLYENEQLIIETERKLSLNESRLFNYRATINDIYKELDSYTLYLNADTFFKEYPDILCPTCFKPLKVKGESPESLSENNESIVLMKKILKNEMEDLQNAIVELENEMNLLSIEKETLIDKRSKLEKRLTFITEYLIRSLSEKEQKLHSLIKEHSEVLNIETLQEDLIGYKGVLKAINDEKKNINTQINTANLEIEENRNSLKEVYNNIVSYLYNGTRRGILEFSSRANNIEVKIAYNEDLGGGIDSGAAAQTVKVIAFDLALLELSLNDSTKHPKLLIHDSPNVNDIDSDVYFNIFKYILELEQRELQQKEEVNFQYIITTISKPEEVLEDHIRLELHSDNEGGKLFGFTFKNFV